MCLPYPYLHVGICKQCSITVLSITLILCTKIPKSSNIKINGNVLVFSIKLQISKSTSLKSDKSRYISTHNSLCKRFNRSYFNIVVMLCRRKERLLFLAMALYIKIWNYPFLLLLYHLRSIFPTNLYQKTLFTYYNNKCYFETNMKLL